MLDGGGPWSNDWAPYKKREIWTQAEKMKGERKHRHKRKPQFVALVLAAQENE